MGKIAHKEHVEFDAWRVIDTATAIEGQAQRDAFYQNSRRTEQLANGVSVLGRKSDHGIGPR